MRELAFLWGLFFMIRQASAFVVRTKSFHPLSLARHMSASDESCETLRVLALHGSEGNGLDFSTKLYPLRDVLLKENVDMQISVISAPFKKGRGFAWWTMEPGVRSFNAEEYLGFQESADTVLQGFASTSPDLVVAHSQGAILVAALLAQNLIPEHPPKGYILNGVAWPNPYGQQLFDLKFDGDDRPRILFVMGQQDTINPLASAKQVQESLGKSGCHVAAHTHSGGHSVPDDPESSQAMAEWIVED